MAWRRGCHVPPCLNQKHGPHGHDYEAEEKGPGKCLQAGGHHPWYGIQWPEPKLHIQKEGQAGGGKIFKRRNNALKGNCAKACLSPAFGCGFKRVLATRRETRALCNICTSEFATNSRSVAGKPLSESAKQIILRASLLDLKLVGLFLALLASQQAIKLLGFLAT